MDRRTTLALALSLLAPLAAGCLSDGPEAVPAAAPAQDAEGAGERTGLAPVAPKEAFAVGGDDGATAFPVALASTPARDPVTIDLSGEFRPADCRPLNFGPFEEVLGAASVPRRWHDLSEDLRVADVFAYNVTLSFTQTAQNWAEVYVAYGLGSTIRSSEEPTREKTDVVFAFEGQGYRASQDDMAWLVVGCRYGAMTTPIPYTLTATFRFAEGAVPAEAPMLVEVPEGASRLFVRGLANDGSEGVMSHFRVFRPDDTMLCECALGSEDEIAVVELDGPGEHVVIVDHTANGFVTLALDAPSPAPLRALSAEWVELPVLASTGGAIDQTVELDLPRVPLVLFAFVTDHEGAGVGKKTSLSLTNARGEPLRATWGGHLAWEDPVGGDAWLGFWPQDWEFVTDHHAYAEGQHVARVTAEELRGDLFLVYRQYVR